MTQHDIVGIEITYPHHMGGNMMDGYMCNDNQMAQSSIDFACESATIIERERIIALIDKAFIYDEPVVIDRDRLIALIEEKNHASKE